MNKPLATSTSTGPSCCFPKPDGGALGKQSDSRWENILISVASVSTISAWHFRKTRSLTFLSLSGSRWSGSDSQFVILSSLWLRLRLFCALRSAIQFHGGVNNSVWFLLSTDCSWNVLWLSGNRLVFRFQHADAREFPSAHLSRQWAGLCVSPALGNTAKLDQGCVPALSAFTANWERH